MKRKQRTTDLTITPEALPYLKTLRRIPADVRLSMATRAMEPCDDAACVCGWAIRDALLAATGNDPGEDVWDSDDMCRDRFGGDAREWNNIYGGVIGLAAPLIEEAFLIAVAEAAEGRQLATSKNL